MSRIVSSKKINEGINQNDKRSNLDLQLINFVSSRAANLNQNSTNKCDNSELELENSIVRSLTDENHQLGTSLQPMQDHVIKALYVTYTNLENDQRKSIDVS